MNTPLIEFLGWDKPAIELVAARLHEALTNPQTAAGPLWWCRLQKVAAACVNTWPSWLLAPYSCPESYWLGNYFPAKGSTWLLRWKP